MPRTGQPAIRLVGAVQRALAVVDAHAISLELGWSSMVAEAVAER